MQRSLKHWWPLFVLPTALAFLGAFLIPFGMGLYLSFCDFTTLSDAVFVGFDNYILAFSDAAGEFVHALWYTALFAAVSAVLVNALGLAAALLLSRGFRGARLFRAAFFAPNLIGGIVLGWVWQVFLNGVLSPFGRTLVSGEWYGFWGLMAVVCWQQLGYMMIIYLAAIAALPQETLEAAAIDGASAGQTLARVKLPMLRPSVAVCAFLTLTNGFRLFDQNLALTNGMPGNRSQLLALNIYATFYGRAGWAGAGQAKAVVFCLIAGAVALAQLRLTRFWEARA